MGYTYGGPYQLPARRGRARPRVRKDGLGRASVRAGERAAALGRRAPACYVINHDQRADRLLRVHKLLDGLAWLPWRRLEAVGGRDGGCTPIHRAAWLRLRDEPMQECVLVLEDDAVANSTPFEDDAMHEPKTKKDVNDQLDAESARRLIDDSAAL